MSGRLFFEVGPRPVTAAHRLRQKGIEVVSKSSAFNKSSNAPAELFASPASGAAAPAWKQEVNQRLAAHRNRRIGLQDEAADAAGESPKTVSERAAAAAARVAARYAKAPSYSELLAGEARAVVRAAGAAAEAARNAQAAAQAVLTGLEYGPGNAGFWEPESSDPRAQFDSHFEAAIATAEVAASATARWQDQPPIAPHAQETPWAGAQPRWEEALPAYAPGAGRDVWSEMRLHPSAHTSSQATPRYADEQLEGELFHEGSYDAMGSATVEPVQHIPANLIEFPRELVATRKARPRLAEGPFYDASHANAQLSIFEVDPELLAPPIYLHDPHAVAPPEWASIELEHTDAVETVRNRQAGYPGQDYPCQTYADLDYAAANRIPAEPQVEHFESITAHSNMIAQEPPLATQRPEAKPAQAWSSAAEQVQEQAAELLVAPFSDRLLAGIVDGALVTLAFLAAAVVVIASTDHPPAGRFALAASGCGLLLFGMLYQFLFLSYAEEGTPGMRYARIALCTFDDDNPTREQMRKRIPAMLLATLPAGLGLAWAAVDGEHLGLHDRLTRTYQRKY